MEARRGGSGVFTDNAHKRTFQEDGPARPTIDAAATAAPAAVPACTPFLASAFTSQFRLTSPLVQSNGFVRHLPRPATCGKTIRAFDLVFKPPHILHTRWFQKVERVRGRDSRRVDKRVIERELPLRSADCRRNTLPGTHAKRNVFERSIPLEPNSRSARARPRAKIRPTTSHEVPRLITADTPEPPTPHYCQRHSMLSFFIAASTRFHPVDTPTEYFGRARLRRWTFREKKNVPCRRP